MTKPNLQAQLARERNRIAADRTILSWIRLSLTLIGIGFGIDQTVTILFQTVGEVFNPLRLSHWAGLSFVGLGIYALITAALDYRGELNRLAQPEYVYTPRHPLGETMAIALLIVSLLFFGRILVGLLLV